MLPAPKRLPLRTRLLLKPRSIRIWALEQARLYVGTKEHPPRSNRGPHIDRWELWCNGMLGYPWCAAFACGMYRESTGYYVPEPKAASVGYLELWAKKVGAIVETPRKGDLVCYRFDADNWPDHIGIIDNYYPKTRMASTIEGNTSAGNDANGGEVQVRYRRLDSRCKFIRLDKRKLKALP